MVAKGIHYQDIIKGVGAGLCLLDKDFHILWINKYQADWFGASQDICGKYCYKIFEHRQHICRGCPTLKVFKTGKIHTTKRIGFTKEGEKRYYQLTVSPIKDNQGRVTFALELVQDITESVVQERRNSLLIARLKDMYHHLSGVNKKLRQNIQKLKGLSEHMLEFKSALSHKYHHKLNELIKIKEELEDIFKINHTLTSAVDLRKISSLITRLTCELTHAEASTLRLVDDHRNTLAVISSYGLSEKIAEKLPVLKIGESICGKAAKSKKPLVVYDIDKDRRVKDPKLLKDAGYRSIVYMPVIFQNRVLGVLSTFSKKPQHFSKEIIEVLSIFTSQVAIALQESRHYQDIHKNYFETIHALVLALEARDHYVRGHTERVTKYAIQTGRLLQMPKAELDILRYAGAVHDLGKISIPDFILNKPGKLTPSERAVIELHPVKGAEMLEPLEFLRPAIPAIRHHHERFDGTGYPDGLEKDTIPLMARILACADAFDAMTSDRPYRNRRLTTDEALSEIKNNCGSQFDPHIAHSFIHLISSLNK